MTVNEKKNYETCLRIAKEIEAYHQGRAYKCPECGETVIFDEDDGTQVYDCTCCGMSFDKDCLEQLSLWDYFADALDIEYRIGANREYRSVQIMITFGGPNIYIDTATEKVKLYWWTEEAHCPIFDACEEIDEMHEELFRC